jgi:undecaprenyl-diphosphatase
LTLSKKLKLQTMLFGVIAGLISFALVKLGGALYYDPRPFVAHNLTPLFPHGTDNGFPSDHTVLGAYIAFTIFSVSKRMGILLLILTIAIGLSRVIGHIHSPIDILGSLLFASVGYIVAWKFTPGLYKYLEGRYEHI